MSEMFKRINAGYYMNKLEYQMRWTYVCPCEFYKIEGLNWVKYCPQCGKKIPAKEEFYADYNHEVHVYNEEERRLYELFREDLRVEFGTVDNPKEAMIFNRAWEHGHSDGFSSVYYWYSDLVDLIK